MEFKSGQALQALDEIKRPIGMDSHVRQSCRAVASHSATSKTMQSEINMLVCKRPARVSAKSAAVLGRVEGSGSIRARLGGAAAESGRSYIFARKHAISEAAIHSEDFIVSEAGLESKFCDDIGRWIKRIIGVKVVKTAADPSR